MRTATGIDSDPGTGAVPEPTTSRGGGLVVTDLKIQFGGRTAVDGISLAAPLGAITGLIGPNGAGKTTTFNACSGLLRLAGGSVELLGQDVTRLNPARRARLGLGRTFQRMELCDELSVTQNVALGREAGLAGSNPLTHLAAGPSARRDTAERVELAVDWCGLAAVRNKQAGRLSTGERRRVELARAVAADFRVIMLDEPSSGLDTAETEEFATVLEGVVHERGTGVLLVEHDIALIRRVCSYIYVLDFGELIEQGPVAEVLASATVAAAYLGREADDA